MSYSIDNKIIKLIDELNKRGSVDSLSKIVKGIELDWFQTYTLGYSILTKKSLVSLDTGLGKTLIAIGLMNYMKEIKPGMKWIYICEKSNMVSPTGVLSKISKHSNLTVVSTTAASDDIVDTFIRQDINNFDVIVLSYEAVIHPVVNKYLFDNKHLFNNVIVDESHRIGNGTSLTSRVVKGMCKEAEFVLFTTATPLRINPNQIVNQIDMIDRLYFKEPDKYVRQFEIKDSDGKVVDYGNLPQIGKDIRFRYVGFSREDLGLKGKYKSILEICEPKIAHLQASRKDMHKVIKGDKDSHGFNLLKERLTNNTKEGKKGLIYCNTNDNKRMLLDELSREGFRVEVIDGSLSDKRLRPQVEKSFNKGEIDFIITNITTGLDLQCDYIIFWELTLDVKQMVGRGERGLKGNDLEIVFFITRDTVEEQYFIENIFKRSLILKEVLGKDIGEIEDIERDLNKL